MPGRRTPALLLAALLLLGLPWCGSTQAAEPAPIDWQRVAEDSAALLSSYIRIDTQNPPGTTTAAAAFLAAELRESGIPSESVGAVPEKPSLIARLKGRGPAGKPIVLLNHMDVVPADPARWSFPPFSGEIRDGIVYGRGALDMKGLGVAMLMAMRLLADRHELPQHDLVFLAVPDEEVGGAQGAAWLAQNRPDLLDVEAVWDEGGIGSTDLLPAPALMISVTEKQVLWCEALRRRARRTRLAATARCRAAPPRGGADPHPRQSAGAAPDADHARGLSPRRRAGERDGRLRHAPPEQPGGVAVRRWHAATGAVGAAMTRDTIALTMLDAGYKPNVIPGARRGGAGLPPAARYQAGGVHRAAAQDHRRSRGQDRPAAGARDGRGTSPTDTPLFRAMRTRRVHGLSRRRRHRVDDLGGTDSRFFRRRGVPAYGFFPVLYRRSTRPPCTASTSACRSPRSATRCTSSTTRCARSERVHGGAPARTRAPSARQRRDSVPARPRRPDRTALDACARGPPRVAATRPRTISSACSVERPVPDDAVDAAVDPVAVVLVGEVEQRLRARHRGCRPPRPARGGRPRRTISPAPTTPPTATS